MSLLLLTHKTRPNTMYSRGIQKKWLPQYRMSWKSFLLGSEHCHRFLAQFVWWEVKKVSVTACMVYWTCCCTILSLSNGYMRTSFPLSVFHQIFRFLSKSLHIEGCFVYLVWRSVFWLRTVKWRIYLNNGWSGCNLFILRQKQTNKQQRKAKK